MHMRQAITTKFLGPTNTKGQRVSVKAAGGMRLIAGWDYALSVEENHAAAARELAAKLGWRGQWAGGCQNENGDYVFVNVIEPAFSVGAAYL